MTFEAWVDLHCLRFGLATEADAKMLLSWGPAFAASGYTVAELAEATDWMTARSAPRFRADHLQMIQQRIAERRSAAAARLLADIGESESVCTLCDSTGWVVVPHPVYIRLGEWVAPWPTCGVACDSCRLGQLRLEKMRDGSSKPSDTESQKRLRRTMTYSDYERFNPSWREQLAARAKARVLIGDATSRAQTLDKQLGELSRQFAMPARGKR